MNQEAIKEATWMNAAERMRGLLEMYKKSMAMRGVFNNPSHIDIHITREMEEMHRRFLTRAIQEAHPIKQSTTIDAKHA